MDATSLERINVNFPRPVLEDLRKLVPAKHRSEVIARATARELRRLKLAAYFESLATNPLWEAAPYPALPDGAAIDKAISEMRASGMFTSTQNEATTTRQKARRE